MTDCKTFMEKVGKESMVGQLEGKVRRVRNGKKWREHWTVSGLREEGSSIKREQKQ